MERNVLHGDHYEIEGVDKVTPNAKVCVDVDAERFLKLLFREFRANRRNSVKHVYADIALTVALMMMITSAVCWGSWANTFKGVKELPLRALLLGLRRRNLSDLAGARLDHGQHRAQRR